MSRSKITRTLTATVVASLAAALPAPLSSAATKTGIFTVTARTGGARHISTNAALITGSIDARGLAGVTYYFRYGPVPPPGAPPATLLQTAVATDTKPTEKLKVGQAITRLLPETTYQFKLVIVGPEGARVEEKVHTFRTKGPKQRATVPKTLSGTYGQPLLISGTIGGTAVTRVQLEETPYPYREPFIALGTPVSTSATGAFTFRLPSVTASMELRVVTLTPLPAYSPVIHVQVHPNVVLHLRKSGLRGIVRLYGTITPALRHAVVAIQLEKETRPHGKEELTTRWVNQFTTNLKKGRGSSSRFSVIIRVSHAGRYRAWVALPRAGLLVSGPSLNTYFLAAARTHGKVKKKH